jgi:hypothetical protein
MFSALLFATGYGLCAFVGGAVGTIVLKKWDNKESVRNDLED